MFERGSKRAGDAEDACDAQSIVDTGDCADDAVGMLVERSGADRDALLFAEGRGLGVGVLAIKSALSAIDGGFKSKSPLARKRKQRIEDGKLPIDTLKRSEFLGGTPDVGLCALCACARNIAVDVETEAFVDLKARAKEALIVEELPDTKVIVEAEVAEVELRDAQVQGELFVETKQIDIGGEEFAELDGAPDEAVARIKADAPDVFRDHEHDHAIGFGTTTSHDHRSSQYRHPTQIACGFFDQCGVPDRTFLDQEFLLHDRFACFVVEDVEKVRPRIGASDDIFSGDHHFVDDLALGIGLKRESCFL